MLQDSFRRVGAGRLVVEDYETPDAADPQYQFVWSPRHIDAPVVRFHDGDTNGTIDDTLYYTTDANMNVTALVNTSGTVLERVVYDPYGNPTFYDGSWTSPSATSSYDNVVLYCGYRLDAETGLYHVRHRVYHATLGRWNQRDLIGYTDGMSLYRYVNGAPVLFVDPSGSSLMFPQEVGTAQPNEYWAYSDQYDPAAMPPGLGQDGQDILPPSLTQPAPPRQTCPVLSRATGTKPEWFKRFDELGCCDCVKVEVQAQTTSFAMACTKMRDMADERTWTLYEALEATREGVVATAAGERTELYCSMPECVRKVTDEFEESTILTASWFAGMLYNTPYSYGRQGGGKGKGGVGNAFLLTEARRSELMVYAISVRLAECERLKAEHSNWRDCCKC